MLDLLSTGIGEGPPMVPESIGEDWLAVFVLIYVFIGLLGSALSIVCYVLHSLGLYTIAERRGIRHGWLAWVPVGSAWLLGSISDQYQYLVKGKIKNRRRALTGLSILLYILLVVYIIAMVAMVISMVTAEPELAEPSSLSIALLITSVLMMVVVSLVMTVYQYIAYYDLYSSCQPDNAVVYLVLSILASITMPFLVFINRNKDLGMPPRKQPKPQQVQEPAVIPAAPETEENPEETAEQETEAAETAAEETEAAAPANEAQQEKTATEE